MKIYFNNKKYNKKNNNIFFNRTIDSERQISREIVSFRENFYVN